MLSGSSRLPTTTIVCDYGSLGFRLGKTHHPMNPEVTSTSAPDPETFVEDPRGCEVAELRARRRADRDLRRRDHANAPPNANAPPAAPPPAPPVSGANAESDDDEAMHKRHGDEARFGESFHSKCSARHDLNQISGWQGRAAGISEMLAQAQRAIAEADALFEAGDEDEP
ncbi:hypothetical protein M885DRAFT_621956 [Pelagophyceae sp. CCMP2097]|nr:hypothetical protein M885DRAFT_621956 [Pelagophyceae sp. CCMP2097]